MAIIVSKNNKDAKKIDQLEFGLESNIQEYVLDNPNVIPLYDINEDIRLFIAAREFRTTSGPIDALGFDQNGNIYIIETKLYKNPDKRTVVAQALDYGASLWKNTINSDDFITQLDAHSRKTFNDGFINKYADFFELEDASSNVETIISNLNDGNIKFVVMMDKLHDALKNLILYVNQNSKFDIYAVELEYYKHDEFEIIIPKLFGNEVKKDVASSGSSNGWSPIDRDQWLQSVRGELEDNILRISAVYDTIGEKTHLTGKAFGDYFHILLQNSERYSRFFGSEKGADIEICNNGQMTFFGFAKKDTPHMQFARRVAEKVVEQGLFNKNIANLEKEDFNIMYSQMNRADSDKLATIHEETAREMDWL